jgi:hypothetical protein
MTQAPHCIVIMVVERQFAWEFAGRVLLLRAAMPIVFHSAPVPEPPSGFGAIIQQTQAMCTDVHE